MITMNVNDVLSALALSPRGPWQALHPDLAGLYVFGSCATRWAGARGFGLSKPSKSVLFQAFWDFASSLAEYSSDNSSIGKAKQRINEASKGSTKHPKDQRSIQHPGFFLRLSSVRCRVAAGLDFRPWWFWPAWRSSAGPFRCFLHWFQHHLGTHQQSSHLRKPVPGPFLVHADSYVKLLNNKFNERLCMVHAMGFLIYRVVLLFAPVQYFVWGCEDVLWYCFFLLRQHLGVWVACARTDAFMWAHMTRRISSLSLSPQLQGTESGRGVRLLCWQHCEDLQALVAFCCCRRSQVRQGKGHPHLLDTFGWWQVPVHLGIRTVYKESWFFNALC